MNFENEENKEYEWKIQNASKPGIKDWEKRAVSIWNYSSSQMWNEWYKLNKLIF